jgi:hypothetical protein
MADTETPTSDLHKVTLNFIPRAYGAILTAAARDGINKTDAVNRAVQLYDYVQAKRGEGYRVLFERDGRTEEMVVL